MGWRAPRNEKLVLIIDDPDAPDPKAPQRVWVHWVLYNIPPETKGLPENTGKAGLPHGIVVGLNDFEKVEYGAPVHPSVGTATSISSTRWISPSV